MDLFKTKSTEEMENKQEHKLKKLKRKNRYYQGMILLGALQISSLMLCYYLGRSSKNE